MKKSERLILKAFLEMKVPKDFDRGVENTLLVDAIQGLVSRAYSNECIEKRELDLYNLNADTKQRMGSLVSQSIDNLIFYDLIKLCYLIMYRYSSNN